MALSTRRRQLVYLVALAAALKLGYFLGYAAQLPFLDAPLFDSVVYVHQAEAIRAGRFGDPSLVAFGPLYGWFLAVFGSAAPVVQLGLGLLNVVLLYRLVERRFGDASAALVAAALYVGYGLLMFYESKLLSETLGLTLALSATYLYVSPSFVAGRTATSAGVGALFALAILARPNLLFAAPFFVLLALIDWGEGTVLRARMRRSVIAAAALGLVLCANGLWNLAHTGRFVPIILRSQTASIATSTEWDGTLDAFGGGAPSAWDVVDQARDELARPADGARDIDWTGWITGAPTKLLRTFGDVETTFQYGYYGERTEVMALAVLPVTFGMLLLLGLAGAAALWRGSGPRALLPWLPLIIGVVLTTTLFHPSSRYRVSMALPLLALSGVGVMAIERLETRRLRITLAAVAACACIVLAVRTYTYELNSPAMWHLRVAEGEAVRGDIDAMEKRIERARALAHDDPEALARIRYIEAMRRGQPVSPADGSD